MTPRFAKRKCCSGSDSRRESRHEFEFLASWGRAGTARHSNGTPAQAQNWPTRTVKFIVPFGPGAGADIGARLFAEKLQTKWGQPVVIENKPGGDGIVAIQAYLGANDDHVLMFGPSGGFVVHPFTYSRLPYNQADLIPIVRVSNTILAVAVKTDTPYNHPRSSPRPHAPRRAHSTPVWCRASPS